MTRLATFGLEFEVQTEAPALVSHLHAQGLCSEPTMHGWHCDCPRCDAWSTDYLFFAQTDSSCSGEVITTVLHHDPDHERCAPEVFDILQDAALDVDAEPGLGAGMHVHVGIDGLTKRQLDNAFYAYLKWEPVLATLARGRWDCHRGNNETARDCVHETFTDYVGYAPWDELFTLADDLDWRAQLNLRRDLRSIHGTHDRHNFLNLKTRKPTWEFRLWNSTRSAWRMEMFTRLSVALLDPALNRLMLDTEKHGASRTADRLAVLLHFAGHERAAELVHRQNTYTERVAYAPLILTEL